MNLDVAINAFALLVMAAILLVILVEFLSARREQDAGRSEFSHLDSVTMVPDAPEATPPEVWQTAPTGNQGAVGDCKQKGMTVPWKCSV